MKKIFLILTLALFASCEENNDDQVKTVPTSGAVEVQLTVRHLDNTKDLMITTKKIWYQGTAITKYTFDTIPTLGTTTEEGEDEDGNTTNLTIPKDYELYITVK